MSKPLILVDFVSRRQASENTVWWLVEIAYVFCLMLYFIARKIIITVLKYLIDNIVLAEVRNGGILMF